MAQTLPKEPWRESEEEWGKRLKATVASINHKHDIEGSCREMPERTRELVNDRNAMDSGSDGRMFPCMAS